MLNAAQNHVRSDELEELVEESAFAVEDEESDARPALPVESSDRRIRGEMAFAHGIAHFSFELITLIARASAWFLGATIRYLRRHPGHALLTILLSGAIILLLLTGSRVHTRLRFTEISDRTVDAIIGASRFTREYQSEEVARGGNQELLRAGAPVWAQREAVRAVLSSARKAGLSVDDQAVLLATAEIESGFNPMAHANGTSACGLFQFIRDTGRLFGLSPEQCMDPWINAETGVQHYQTVYERVRKDVERLDGAERLFKTFALTYFLHHDGLSSSNPSDDVKATVLDGVPFLLHVHTVLLEEAEAKRNGPSFADAFADDLWGRVAPFVTALTSSSDSEKASVG